MQVFVVGRLVYGFFEVKTSLVAFGGGKSMSWRQLDAIARASTGIEFQEALIRSVFQ